MTIHTDCRQYRASVPCACHKRTGLRCGACGEYAPVDERIVIVKLDAMGDVLRTTACLEPLKRQHPRSHVTWITRAAAAQLLAGNPHVDRVLTVESNYLEFVHGETFDLALGPDADPLSAAIMRLVHAREKRGFVSDGRGGVAPLNAAADAWWRMGLDDDLKRKNRRTYGEWLYDICELQPPIARPWFHPSAAALRMAERVFAGTAAGAGARICFNTGAGPRWEEKRWKARHYAALARLVHRRWPGATIALVGGPREREFNAALLTAEGGMVDAGTEGSIDEFAALIASSDWVLTSDSLGYHLACAVGTPAFCVVGPTAPWELDSYGTNRVLHAGVECIACYLAKCPLATTCMDALSAEDVWSVIAQWDGQSAGGRVPVAATAPVTPFTVDGRRLILAQPAGGPHGATRGAGC